MPSFDVSAAPYNANETGTADARAAFVSADAGGAAGRGTTWSSAPSD